MTWIQQSLNQWRATIQAKLSPSYNRLRTENMLSSGAANLHYVRQYYPGACPPTLSWECGALPETTRKEDNHIYYTDSVIASVVSVNAVRVHTGKECLVHWQNTTVLPSKAGDVTVSDNVSDSWLALNQLYSALDTLELRCLDFSSRPSPCSLWAAICCVQFCFPEQQIFVSHKVIGSDF